MKTINPSLTEDDGFPLPETGHWSEWKHRRFGYYMAIFASSMKKKWDYRIYIDLFAGPGKWKIQKQDKIIPGSPLIALEVQDPFDRYVFCEFDPTSIDSLKNRVEKYFRKEKERCEFIPGDSNQNVSRILNSLPRFSATQKGLSLCVVDPYKAANLQFDTIQSLARRIYVDFMVLIPSYMDIHRNEQNYTRRDNPTIDKFIGSNDWRGKWDQEKHGRSHFGIFIADQFGERMKELGFIYTGVENMEIIRQRRDAGLKLYHLAFFSKHKLGTEFWKTTREQTSEQLSFL